MNEEELKAIAQRVSVARSISNAILTATGISPDDKASMLETIEALVSEVRRLTALLSAAEKRAELSAATEVKFGVECDELRDFIRENVECECEIGYICGRCALVGQDEP